MTTKTKKILLICALTLSAAVLLFFGCKKGVELYNAKNADELFAAGDYAGAREWYEKNGSAEDIARCDYELDREAYEAAAAQLAAGEYDAARLAFEALGDFEDAADRALECSLFKARALTDAGSYTDALDVLAALPEDHTGAQELTEEAREGLYRQALAATYECRMDEAVMLWNSLGSYKDSDSLLKRCMSRIVSMAAGTEERVNYSPYAGRDVGDGILYWHRLGLIYVPKECNADTRCMIFYPGGYDSALANSYYQDYIYAGTSPNAIILYMYTNGFYDIESHIEDAYRALEEAALENNVFLHDMVVCGASNGAYTAVNTAAYLYENYGIAVRYVLTFDAGAHWAHTDKVLTPEQCDLAAEAGTEFLLFEGAGIGMNKSAIHTMVRHGCDVTIVLCRNSGHYGIIYDAIYKGMLDWVLGNGEQPTDANYTYIPLDITSTYPE